MLARLCLWPPDLRSVVANKPPLLPPPYNSVLSCLYKLEAPCDKIWAFFLALSLSVIGRIPSLCIIFYFPGRCSSRPRRKTRLSLSPWTISSSPSASSSSVSAPAVSSTLGRLWPVSSWGEIGIIMMLSTLYSTRERWPWRPVYKDLLFHMDSWVIPTSRHCTTILDNIHNIHIPLYNKQNNKRRMDYITLFPKFNLNIFVQLKNGGKDGAKKLLSWKYESLSVIRENQSRWILNNVLRVESGGGCRV